MKAFVNKYQFSIFFMGLSAVSILIELWWNNFSEIDHPHYWVIVSTLLFGWASVITCIMANIKARRRA